MFPLENYVRFLEAESEADQEATAKQFLKDIRFHMKDLTGREYINPDDNTVDCVLLFIPNDQVYTFSHERGGGLLDEGIKNKDIFCSPVTLFAILAVIHKAVENFSLEQTSNEILGLLGAF